MSKPTVVTANNRSPARKATWSCIPASRFTSADRGTTTPFGRPVEPDVKITYAGCPSDTGAERSASVTFAAEQAATAQAVRGSSTITVVPAAGSSPARAVDVTVATGAASAIIIASRSAG